MNERSFIAALPVCAGLVFAALLAASCAETRQFAPRPADPGAAAGVEEIVVTAQRAQSRSSALRRSVGEFYREPAPEDVLASVSPGEELWVISTPAREQPDPSADDSPGSGAMLASFAGDMDPRTGEARTVPLPLQHTDVDAAISGYVGTVHVRQKFANPFNAKIEAVYLFPLPEKAAVSEFLMIIGERRIRGILREKEEAQAIYDAARARGHQASLLVQHRPNIFEQKVANIEPGEAIDVDIKYFHTPSYAEGWYTFVFPTVIGPRYNPPGHENPVAAVPRGHTQQQPRGTAVRYLRPDERSAHDLSIHVAIDAGVDIEELESSHEIVASQDNPASARVSLAGRTTIPNRDFILRFRVAGQTIKSNLLSYRDPGTGEGYFTLMVYPPEGVEALPRRPMEMVFVLDCSGSMNGPPLAQAKAAVATALNRLREGDTFQVIRFSEDSSRFGPEPVPATPDNLRAARRYVDSLQGTGGTQMIEGVKAALDFPHDPSRLRFVSFLTDGFIGNEADIIAAVHERIGSSRIFSFGVGSSVNRYLLERMAKEGRGAVAWLGPQDAADAVMDSFFRRISHPALTDLRFDWGGMAVSDVYPTKIPDLFVGRPVVVTGKYSGAVGDVGVSGLVGTTRRDFRIASAARGDTAYLPKLWARLRIAELSDRQSWESDPYGELANAIRSTALEYQLMSAYTSFVAVDSSRRTDGSYGTTVHQAVPVPDGVRYETTVEQPREH